MWYGSGMVRYLLIVDSSQCVQNLQIVAYIDTTSLGFCLCHYFIFYINENIILVVWNMKVC